MARYLSQHTLACLTRQGAEQLARGLFADEGGAGSAAVASRRVLVNMHKGKMLVEFEAPTREALEEWLAKRKFHYDWLLRIELASDGGPLQAV